MERTCNAPRGLQIHPTRQCNLRCLHCYSASAPEERDQLGVTLLRDAITDARAAGYTLAGFSGGEPVLYQPLRELLDHAHECGMITTVTSNGMLLDERRLEMLRGGADLLAISIDGIPESHDRMRASARAFEKMQARLEGVRQSGIPFGFIFTLTQYNLNELDWVANFAFEEGARLLQIHPLEEVGRAAEMLEGARPDDVEAAYSYLETTRLQKLFAGRMLVQLDLAPRELVRKYPERVFADELADEKADLPLAELISPIVIEDDGTVVPIGYGFARKYALGNLHTARLSELAAEWRRRRFPAFRHLCRAVFEEVTAPHELPFFNWYEVIALRAETSVVSA